MKYQGMLNNMQKKKKKRQEYLQLILVRTIPIVSHEGYISWAVLYYVNRQSLV
jgi:hypothetical protein